MVGLQKIFVKDKYGMIHQGIKKDWYEQTEYLTKQTLANQGLGTKESLQAGATVKEVDKFIDLTNKVKNEKVALYSIENSKTLEKDLDKLTTKLLADIDAKFVEGFQLKVDELNDQEVQKEVQKLVYSLTKHFPVTFDITTIVDNKVNITFKLFEKTLVKNDVPVVKK